MNKDKWNEILIEETCEYQKNWKPVNNPKGWAEYKQRLLTFIQNMDLATEVYNLENNIKG